MTPQSLYRRHRPQRFAELVGQEHVSTALRNAVREDRVGHAYLLSGPRGTGKTTTARLLAKSLNCLAPAGDGEPCAECENCLAIASSTFYDLAELDAASNNGVDAIRDLVQSVGIGLGATSRRKVYIVDEVHMLSTAASNALLKTLEEPPEHVVFVLATTDPGKVLPTIRSRTQHFEFALLSHDQLAGHLVDILGREGIEPDDEVIDIVVRRAAGSARDALSLLDQALSLSDVGHLDAERVRDALGDTLFERRITILDALAAEDGAGALLGLAAALADGIAPRQIADDLLRTLRDAFVLDAGGGRIPHEGPADEAERLLKVAEALGRPLLTRGIEVLGRAIVDIRGPAVPDPRLVLEVAILRLARGDAGGSSETLHDRVEALERQIATLRSGSTERTQPAPPSRPEGGPRRALGAFRADRSTEPATGMGPESGEEASAGTDSAPSPSPSTAQSPAPAPPHVEAEPQGLDRDSGDGDPALDLDDVIEAWPVAMGELSPPVRAAIEDAQPIAVEGSVVVFGVPPRRLDAIRKRFQAEADTIRTALAGRLGRTPQFKLRSHDFEASGALDPTSPAATGSGKAPTAGGAGSAKAAGAVSAKAAGASTAGAAGAAGASTAGTEPENGGPGPEGTDPLDDRVDLAELVDAPADAALFEPTAMLQEQLGAEIVEERPRD